MNQFIVPCPVTVASCPAYRFLGYSHLFKNFPQFIVIHTVKGFSVVSEAEVDFLNPLAFSVIQQILGLLWFLCLF